MIEEFGRNGGHVGGHFEGAPLLLLHTVGAKSGQPRTNPVMYQQVGNGFAVFASAAGDDDDPAWFRNVVAIPSMTAEVGSETLRLKARVLDDEERKPIWERQKQDQPGFADYEGTLPHHPGGAARALTAHREGADGGERPFRCLAGRVGTLKAIVVSLWVSRTIGSVDLEQYADSLFGVSRRTVGPFGYVAYFPNPLPRRLEVSSPNVLLLADAEAALGRLAGASRLLPNPQLLVRPYLRREAVASTRIEGTQASLLDVFDAEASDQPLDADVEEVVNYVRAVELGLERLSTLPFSSRLIREMHAVILAGVRGHGRQPGELRTTQNWIGPAGATIETATFVPPPPEDLADLLSDLERFVHEDPQLPPLVQAALLHYQFETIHPFLDGNGRLGRLLIVFFLVIRDRLPEPLLYLSQYFEARRQQYYEALQGVRERGDFEQWLALFLGGARTQALDAMTRAERLTDLRERYRADVRAVTRGAANQLVDVAFEQPVLNTRVVERRLTITRPAALTALRQLVDLGVLVEVRGGPRGQLRWRADEILSALVDEQPGGDPG